MILLGRLIEQLNRFRKADTSQHCIGWDYSFVIQFSKRKVRSVNNTMHALIVLVIFIHIVLDLKSI